MPAGFKLVGVNEVSIARRAAQRTDPRAFGRMSQGR